MSSDAQVAYAVNNAPLSTDGLCALDDGRVVVSRFPNVRSALDATTADPALSVVRHKDLEPQEQERIERALRLSSFPS